MLGKKLFFLNSYICVVFLERENANRNENDRESLKLQQLQSQGNQFKCTVSWATLPEPDCAL